VIGQSYGLSLLDVQSVAERIRPGTAAGLLIIEHTWAIDFSGAVARAGGKMAAQGFLTRQAIMMLGKELEAVAEAGMALELSDAIQMEAAIEAAEAVAVSEAIVTQSARRAVEALVASRLIGEAAMEQAAEVVSLALAIEKSALDDAGAARPAVQSG